jgi:MerR family transcriptional regulator/heat shock protein HspR
MVKEYWTTTEVIELFQVETRFLEDLVEEEILRPEGREDPAEKRFSEVDVERLRLAKLLVEEMGVNLAGVEIILRMRRDMFAMRAQFDAILEDVAENVRRIVR